MFTNYAKRREELLDCLDCYPGKFSMATASTCIMGVAERLHGVESCSFEFAKHYGFESNASLRALLGMLNYADPRLRASMKLQDDLLNFQYSVATAPMAADALRIFMCNGGDGVGAWLTLFNHYTTSLEPSNSKEVAHA